MTALEAREKAKKSKELYEEETKESIRSAAGSIEFSANNGLFETRIISSRFNLGARDHFESLGYVVELSNDLLGEIWIIKWGSQ